MSTPVNAASANKGAAFTISTLLSGVGSKFPPSPGDNKNAASKDDGGEEGECEDVDGQVNAVTGSVSESTIAAAADVEASFFRAGAGGRGGSYCVPRGDTASVGVPLLFVCFVFSCLFCRLLKGGCCPRASREDADS